MKLNLEFYNENQPKEVSLQDEKIFEVLNNENLEDVLEKDTSVNTYIHLSKVKENLLNSATLGKYFLMVLVLVLMSTDQKLESPQQETSPEEMS